MSCQTLSGCAKPEPVQHINLFVSSGVCSLHLFAEGLSQNVMSECTLRVCPDALRFQSEALNTIALQFQRVLTSPGGAPRIQNHETALRPDADERLEPTELAISTRLVI